MAANTWIEQGKNNSYSDLEEGTEEVLTLDREIQQIKCAESEENSLPWERTHKLVI